MRVSVKAQNLPYFCAILIFFDYLFQIALNDIRLVLRISNVQFSFYSFYSIFAVLIIVYLFKSGITKRQLTLMFSCMMFFGVAYVYTLLVNRTALSYVTNDNLLQLFLYFPLILLVFSYGFDYMKLLNYLIQFARLFSVLVLFTVVYDFIKAGNRIEYYDIVLGYQAALCAILLIFSLFTKFNYYDLVFTIVLSLIVLLTSSRGAAVVLVGYVLAFIFRKYLKNSNTYKKAIFVFVSLLLIFILYFYGLSILQFIVIVAKRFNINTRTLNAIFQNDVSVVASNEGRIQYLTQCFNEWKSMPVFGFGLFSDRKILNGVYVHNFIFEILTDYGFFVGIFILVSFFVLLVKSLTTETSKSEFLLLCTVFIVVHLSVSGSYLTNTMFFVLIATLLSGVSVKKL